jgi:hypothetical protein
LLGCWVAGLLGCWVAGLLGCKAYPDSAIPQLTRSREANSTKEQPSHPATQQLSHPVTSPHPVQLLLFHPPGFVPRRIDHEESNDRCDALPDGDARLQDKQWNGGARQSTCNRSSDRRARNKCHTGQHGAGQSAGQQQRELQRCGSRRRYAWNRAADASSGSGGAPSPAFHQSHRSAGKSRGQAERTGSDLRTIRQQRDGDDY